MTKGPTNSSEIIDLTVGESTGCYCNDWLQNPYNELGWAATGAFVGDSALICGGERPKECYSLKPDSAKIVVEMNYTRVDAASVKINDTRYFKWEWQFCQILPSWWFLISNIIFPHLLISP